jgi:hypothetical protein
MPQTVSALRTIVDDDQRGSRVRSIWSLKTANALVALFVVLFMQGCGVTFNVPNTASGESAAPPTGGATAPAPGDVAALTGCTNPNTGVSNGDWGIGDDPVYSNISNTSPVVGVPVYKKNTVFWTSRENGPGQSILLAGAFTNSAKKVRIAAIPPGTEDWQSLVRGSATVVTTTQQGSTGLSFIVPSSLPAGVIGYQIEDLTTATVIGVANLPAVSWIIGVPSETDSDTALQHQIHDCGVEVGGELRIFGKNFQPGVQVVLRAADGSTYQLAPSKSDRNSIRVTVPQGLGAGQYALWVGNTVWDATSSAAVNITIYEPPAFRVVTFDCSGLVGDGKTDNLESLQKCLDIYAPVSPGTQITRISIPPGAYVLSDQLNVRPYEVIAGGASSSTILVGKPKGKTPVSWLVLPQYSALTGLAVKGPVNVSLVSSAGTTTGDPRISGHMFFEDLDVESTQDGPQEQLFNVAGPDIQIYDSTFIAGWNQSLDLAFADGAIEAGNTIVLNNFTGLAITDSQNVIFEYNQTYSENPLLQGPQQTSGGSGLSISRANGRFQQSALSRNIYVGYNDFQHMGSPDQQVITNDGNGGSYLGPVASSSATSVTLADDPAWDWMGTTNPEAAVFEIVFGTGAGQYSFLKNYSGRDIELMTPLQVQPDSTSVVVISQYEQNMTIAHNTLTDTSGAGIVLADSIDAVIEDNPLTNAGAGILISAIGPYGGPAAYGSVFNTDVLRNTISVGEGNLIFLDQGDYLWGLGISDFPGCGVSGLMIRDNTVPSVNTMFSSDGVNGISASVIEQNYAEWESILVTPGFLVQDNWAPTP